MTAAEFRADLRARGLTLKGWAHLNGVDADAVRDVLRGENKGRVGKGHAAAVAMGMKLPPLTSSAVAKESA